APVSLASNSTAIRLPNPVTIPAGQSTASFQISTSVVTTSSTRSLTATYNGVTRRIDVTLRPGGLQSFTANPTNLTAGASSTGTVTLSGPSRSGGTRVALVANSNVINVPSELVIPAGQTSGTFTIRTSYVSSRVTRTVTATLGSVARNVNLTIAPAFDLVVNPTSVVGGSNTTGRVTIPSAAPSGGAVIAVSTNSSALVVPTSVTVPEGQYNALFTIGTRPVSATTGRYVTITYGGVNKSALVTIEPGSSLSNLTVNPSSVRGGQNTTGTVHLAGPAPAGGTTVTLSSNSSAIVVPPSVTIPAGVTSASFTIQTKPVGSTATRTVSAARDGVTRTATVTLTP
ncbi:MAG TPA: hypothetical protein VEX38_07530, partial [Fimbriimonadaceae bacterium]|nr:hypothetical protein [Fimbriimonadaceae bacterium]